MWGEKLCIYAQYLNQTYGLASLVKSRFHYMCVYRCFQLYIFWAREEIWYPRGNLISSSRTPSKEHRRSLMKLIEGPLTSLLKSFIQKLWSKIVNYASRQWERSMSQKLSSWWSNSQAFNLRKRQLGSVKETVKTDMKSNRSDVLT